MTEPQGSRITIDDLVESATQGVLRALEARSISGQDFIRQNGFHVKFEITAGGFPGPIESLGRGSVQLPAGNVSE
jgi:hypothetical protein